MITKNSLIRIRPQDKQLISILGSEIAEDKGLSKILQSDVIALALLALRDMTREERILISMN